MEWIIVSYLGGVVVFLGLCSVLFFCLFSVSKKQDEVSDKILESLTKEEYKENLFI